ncbi:MAG: helix-turn-helix domain-containing protein [Anaerolineae bacterium]|nr:helix-turn-helix domain-containing protein [Anaerolineae bacterium]MDQ7037242.1 helix-turn-helix domain-containing protein [Anaerolineae bacterium]
MKPENIISLNPEKSIRADAVRNRCLLMDTAHKLFEEHGVDSVTMSAIAKEARVGKGTLYRHFADKATLCHALLDENMRDFQQATLRHLQVTPDVFQALQWFLQQAVAYVDKHNELLREVANQGGIDMLRHPAHYWWRQTIYGLLARLQRQGDVDYMADCLYIMLDVSTIRFQRQSGHYDLERIIAGLHMLLDSLVANH